MQYIQELMSPQVMFVIYLFIAFIIALYVLSVVYVFIDARRRGSEYFWAWGLLALLPFVGLIAYNVLRPNTYLADQIKKRGAGADHFHTIHPDTHWQATLEHAEKIGIGTREYELREI